MASSAPSTSARIMRVQPFGIDIPLDAKPINDNLTPLRQDDRWHYVITTLAARWPDLGVLAWHARLEGWDALAWCEAVVAAHHARSASEAV